MCRIITALGDFDTDLILEAAILMSEGSTAEHELKDIGPDGQKPGIRHLDGWGVTFASELGAVECIRGTSAIKESGITELLSTKKIHMLVAHARNATVPEKVGTSFLHPIEESNLDSRCYVFHLGYVPDVHQFLGMSQSEWDSRELWNWLKDSLVSTTCHISINHQELVEKLKSLPATTTAANMVLVDNKSIAICNWYPDTSKYPEYYTLWKYEGAKQLIVSSDRIPHIAAADDWTPLRNNAIIQLDWAL